MMTDEERVLALLIEVFDTDRETAADWYRNEQLIAFGNKTAQRLVEEGDLDAVIEHIKAGSIGGYV